ncbi:hypothetical protein BDK51DRAFT_33183 [Blyttiomyces helicus]|uniref:Uncharacterized protein n=1 Tax=Blyttiomyces helicus TaxID=388810 RepID=A0A4P9W9F2_9FUNG|nr:hypothetical protein BDK51DRAFT_33183 [Blyttiomyces helicus]|eukprot:RKO86836.1 hypothetical protein BDK51DRAFT_33183 [Blyttiomyces helicus]
MEKGGASEVGKESGIWSDECGPVRGIVIHEEILSTNPRPGKVGIIGWDGSAITKDRRRVTPIVKLATSSNPEGGAAVLRIWIKEDGISISFGVSKRTRLSVGKELMGTLRAWTEHGLPSIGGYRRDDCEGAISPKHTSIEALKDGLTNSKRGRKGASSSPGSGPPSRPWKLRCFGWERGASSPKINQNDLRSPS